ncbi:MAG: SRPBCC domain-containing protein [Pseudomonadota bacterium]
MTTDVRSRTEQDSHELVFSRVFAAPPATVFRAWTDPDQLVRWWGPRDFVLTIQEMDVRVGGIWEYVLHGPDGTDYPNRAVFEVVEPPTRLEFLNSGGHVSDDHLTCRMVVTFEDKTVQTLVTLRMQFETQAGLDRARMRGAEQGGVESFERLVEWLK